MSYTTEQLTAAFDKVKNPNHWKDPIDAVIDESERDLVSEAIPYFTATPAFFSEGVVKGTLNVTAEGYRAGPAGDH